MPFNVHQIGLKTGFDRAYRPRSYCSASDEDGGSCCDVRGQLFLGGLTKDELFFLAGGGVNTVVLTLRCQNVHRSWILGR